MGRVDFRAKILRNKPVPRQRNTADTRRVRFHGRLPFVEIHRSREGGHHHELSKRQLDRKSTRLNSSHGYISYAVFCLKKKTNKNSLGGNDCPHTLGGTRPERARSP